ncbi:MAG TPA: ATP-dependent 6-phosphofructokinase [Atribacteraceae bacterium]|nr:ATP-dependent 6-phosphofructokinase [Atribacteraceae bacterium]
MKIRRIGILSGGGDCPGINAVIRGAVKKAILDYDLEVLGILNGFEGLVEGKWRKLFYKDVSGILALGGTILGASNKANPFRYPVREEGKIVFHDYSRKAIDNYHQMEIQALICIGGDGTFQISRDLMNAGLSIVGVPKTIDNDLNGTDLTFGFDTAVHVVTEAIDRLHTTAQSHHRVIVVEVMGRYAGWIALYGGIAGGGDVILIPEIPYDIDAVCRFINQRIDAGKTFSIVVVAEGAHPREGEMVVRQRVEESHDHIRLGGVSMLVSREIEERISLETRMVILGHLQRGGTPTAFDRVLATRFGTAAAEIAAHGQFGYFPALVGSSIVPLPLARGIEKLKTVPLDSEFLSVARSTGICLGE